MHPQPELLTVGHSTLAIEPFVQLLRDAGVESVVDVRRFPASRRHPHFSAEPLAAELAASGLRYEHLASLGGRRTPAPDSPNTGWQVAAFRGYADHLRTAEFAEGRDRLRQRASERRTAVMCAEAQPWR